MIENDRKSTTRSLKIIHLILTSIMWNQKWTRFGYVLAIVLQTIYGSKLLDILTRDKIAADELDALLMKYDKRVRPNYTGNATKVKVAVDVLSIGLINEVDMSFEVSMLLLQEWNDPRLRHNLSKHILLANENPSDIIWTPDTTFVNSKIASEGMTLVGKYKLDIFSNGRVYWSSWITIKLVCDFDFTRYPADKQECSILMESYAYNNEHMRYQWYNFGVILRSSKATQFSLTSFSNETYNIAYPCCGSYSGVKVKFKFQRKISTSLLQFFFPCISLVSVSWLSLWFHKNCVSARVGTGMTLMLTMSTIWLYDTRELPHVSYIKDIDIFFFISFLFILGTLIEFVIVMSGHFKNRKKNQKLKLTIQRQSECLSKQKKLTSKSFTGSSLMLRRLSRLSTQEEYIEETHDTNGTLYDNCWNETTFLNDENFNNKAKSPKIDRDKMPYFYRAYAVIGKPDTVDVIFRFLFPFIYVCFNIYFWLDCIFKKS